MCVLNLRTKRVITSWLFGL